MLNAGDADTAVRLLGVSESRLAQLARDGEVVRASRGLYDRLSIERYLTAWHGMTGRGWDTNTAWAAIAVLSGTNCRWLLERSRFQLEAALRRITVGELVAKSRNRAQVHTFAGHRSIASQLRGEVIIRDWEILGLAGDTGDGVDGYLGTSELAAVAQRFALTASTAGNITLRATGFDLGIVRTLSQASDVLVALDAAGSIDPRARGAGERVLARALARFVERRGATR